MTEHLLQLIDRIQQPHILRDRLNPPQEPKAASGSSKDLLNLVNRVQTRACIEENKILLENRIKTLNRELRAMKHVEKCKMCLLELQLDVERYLGTRIFWWLNLSNDVGEEMKECPQVDDYRIGSYWSGSSDGTVRFIKDRMEWAWNVTLQEIRLTGKARSLLEHWNYSRSRQFQRKFESIISQFFLSG
jgi:hypothetical protein